LGFRTTDVEEEKSTAPHAIAGEGQERFVESGTTAILGTADSYKANSEYLGAFDLGSHRWTCCNAKQEPKADPSLRSG